MAYLSVSLLGPLQITLDERPVAGFAYNKARALLLFLAVEADRPHPRDSLTGLLWPDLPDSAARTNLRQALANLRDAVGETFLLATRDTVQFNPQSDYAVDAHTFDTLWNACQAHPHRRVAACRACIARLEQAAALYRGDFLAEFSVADSAAFEEWALLKREKLHQRAFDALSALTAHCERHGRLDHARQYAQRQLELDPWREETHRQLMRLLARAGQRSAALAQYETCKRVLTEALGVAPTPETTALYERIREGLETPTSSEAEAQRQLPVPPTPIVGRERELRQLGDLLSDPNCRLITVAGLGGIGKTRLALEAAGEERASFTHGAAFVSLAGLSSSELIAPSLMGALNVTLQGQSDPAQALLAYLRDKELLLVLDNFEHLLDGTDLLAEIIQRAPGVTLLVTSRERLALQAEWLVELSGLDYPAGQAAQGLEAYGAMALFAQRVRQVQSQFTLAGENARAAARICQLVEGLPLAIELAAASVRYRSCAALAAEIEASLGALAAPMRDTPERHHSMRAAFEQSWRLLSEEEQHVFTRLSVFRGGFDAEAAEQVAQATPPLLAALLDKSLLRRDLTGRHEMHELLRQYAHARLREEQATEQTRAKHLAYFSKLAEEAELQLLGAQQQIWLNRLEYDHNNLRSALAWAHNRGDIEAIARLGVGLWRFWYIRGHLYEGRQWLAAAVANKTTAPAAIRAKALRAAGILAKAQQDFSHSRALIEESLALFRTIGDKEGEASSLLYLGHAMLDQELYAEAEPQYQESLAICRALGDKHGISRALDSLGLVTLHQKDYRHACSFFEESLDLSRVLGNKQGTATTLCNLGLAALYEGDYAQSTRWLRESLVLSWALGDKEVIAWCLEGLAAISSGQSQPEHAARLYGTAEILRHGIGVPLPAPYRDHYERMVANARAGLDEAAFAAAWSEGRAMPLEEAVAYALKEGEA